MVLNGYLPLGMLDRENAWMDMDGICTRCATHGVAGMGKAFLREIILWAAAVVGGAISAWLEMDLCCRAGEGFLAV